MRLRVTFLALVSSTLLVACGDERGGTVAEQLNGGFPGELMPRGASGDYADRAWISEERRLTSPFAITVLDDSIALVLDHYHPGIHLYDLRSGDYIARSSSEDAVATEFIAAQQIAVSPGDPFLFAGYDFAASALTRYRISPDGWTISPYETQQVDLLTEIRSPVWHNDGTVTFDQPRASSFRATLSPGGTAINPTGIALDSLAPSWVTSDAWLQAMTGTTCASPDRSMLARAWRFMGQLSVFDSAGNRIQGAHYERFYDPSFIVDDAGGVIFSAQSTDVRVGYLSCAATKDFIFALFSGHNTRNSGRGRASGASQIHVYDWRGNLKGGFRVNNSSSAIGVAPNGRLLLVVERAPVPTLVAFDVPRQFRTR